MSDASKAVFLSYASQDAAVVRRIAEALRASGVEVWFDQNELVGGDAWDAKIRGQIASCALFVPVISAATQARLEGYFRVEWKLAAQRTHAMAEEKTFLLPVVIDDTRDAEALVPGEFRAVQWTRLPGGETPEKFCARVRRLLSGSTLEPGRPRPGLGGEGGTIQPRSSGRRVPVAAWIGVLITAAIIGVFAVWQPRKTLAIPATASDSPSAATAPRSEARKRVAQARALFDSGDYVNREDVFLAEDLLKKAQALDNTDAEIWAAQGELSRQMIILGYERTSSRFELLRQQSERAYKLDPNLMASQISYAGYLQWAGKESAKESARLMEALLSRAPDNRKAYRVLGMAWSYAGDIDKTMEVCRRSNALSGGDPVALMMGAAQLQWWGRYAEIESALDQADAVAVTGRSHVLRVLVDLFWHGDTDRAVVSLEKWPLWMQREDRGAFVASQVWMWRREPDRAIAVLSPIARDAFFDTYYTGPKAVLLALAHEMAGRPQAARAEWENAKRVATRMVAEQPSLKRALTLKAVAMAKLGETVEAEAILRSLEQAGELRSEFWSSAHPSALLRVTLGRADEVATRLATESMVDMVAESFPAPRAALQLNPVYDTVRATPAFQRLMAAAPAPVLARKRGNASPAPVANDKSALADKSLVVLPLENLSPDPENAFFTDGMHAEIISTLQAVPELKVLSREAALALTRDGGAAEAGRRAGVAHMLAGSVRREGTKVRVLLDLRRVSDDALLWSAPKVTRELKEALALQAEVAEEVARVLRARFDKGTFAGLRFLAADPRAYDSYLKAHAQYQRNTSNPASILQAVALMEEGMTFDSQFMPGARLLGRMYVRAYLIESNPNAAWGFAAEGKKWSELAGRLMPGGAGDSSLAFYYGAVGLDPVRSLAYAENAVRALPNDFEGHHYVGLALRGMGRTHEALVHMERSIALDPLNSPSWAAAIETRAHLRQVEQCLHWLEKYQQVNLQKFLQAGVLAWRFCLDGSLPGTLDDGATMFARQTWLWRSRRFEELAQLVERLRVAPDPVNHNNLSRLLRRCDALRWLGREQEAMGVARELANVVERMNALPDWDVSAKARRLAVARSRLGEFDAAIAAARRAVEAREGPGVMRRWTEEVLLAEVYAYARRPRECAEVLAKLLRVPSGLTVPMLKADPIWDHVRDDAAIQALLADPNNSAPL